MLQYTVKTRGADARIDEDKFFRSGERPSSHDQDPTGPSPPIWSFVHGKKGPLKWLFNVSFFIIFEKIEAEIGMEWSYSKGFLEHKAGFWLQNSAVTYWADALFTQYGRRKYNVVTVQPVNDSQKISYDAWRSVIPRDDN